MMNRMVGGCLVLLAAAAAPLSAQVAAHPDLAGTWVLDSSQTRSDGVMPTPPVATWTIVAHGDTLLVDEVSGPISNHFKYAADGKPWANQMNYLGSMLSLTNTLAWSGATLIIDTRTQYNNADVQQIEHWSVSADGKALTVQTNALVGENPYAAFTLVFRRKS